MYIESLDLDINNISKYTREDIKNIYKKIAIECHPDKLCNIKDIDIKNQKIDRFKKASIGYKNAIEDFDKYGELIDSNASNASNAYNTDYNMDDIRANFDMYNDIDIDIDFTFLDSAYKDLFQDKDYIQKTFVDVAKLFFKNGFKKKDYYNPSTKVIKHDIILPVSYYDLHNSKKKRVQILLKGVDEPFNISILCKKNYPRLVRQYIDDSGNEHEIEIKMMISNDYNYEDSSDSGDTSDDQTLGYIPEAESKNKKLNMYTHKIRNNIIDLITNIDINLKDYLIGSIKVIKYIDNSYIDIVITPFNIDNIVIKNKGLIGGDLIIKLKLQDISNNNWNKLDDESKKLFIKYLDDMYK
jgi:hypothetical protein